MAEYIKDRHHLLALKISRTSLDADGDVLLELQRIERGKNSLGDRWLVKASQLGAVLDDNPFGAVTLPDGVITPMAEIVEGAKSQFDVLADGKLVFSKQQEGRFPEVDEIISAL